MLLMTYKDQSNGGKYYIAQSWTDIKESGNNIRISKLFIEFFKDVLEIWSRRMELPEYWIWSHLIANQKVLRGVKVNQFGDILIDGM